MSELLTYVSLGFHHIADLAAADHMLFLLALAAVYRVSDWRSAIWVITAFTVGHSITLGLAVTGLLSVPTNIIEFLIPVTIVITCLANLRDAGRSGQQRGIPFRAALAMVFGLVHGTGFANYLEEMFVDRIAVPLLGFNLGIEVGQLIILTVTGVALTGVDHLLGLIRNRRISPLRIRISAVSLVIGLLASRMVVERSGW
jgi:hypothetical protein